MSKFHKMLEKKRDISPSEKNAKMSVLKDLKHAASEAAGSRLGKLKKVSVMSDSDEGMKKGLQHAQEMTGDMPPGMHDGGMAMGQQFSYSDGGQIESEKQEEDPHSTDSPNQMEEAMEALDEEDTHHEDPSAEEMHDEEGEYRGMDIGAIEEKIKHLMALRNKMGSK